MLTMDYKANATVTNRVILKQKAKTAVPKKQLREEITATPYRMTELIVKVMAIIILISVSL